MRALGLLATGALVVSIVAACSGGDTTTGAKTGSGSGGSTITADYCSKYCNAQASSGTQTGSLTECLTDCCKDVKGGCPASGLDAGSSNDPLGDCAKPCGSNCCTTTEACSVEGAAPACVPICVTGSDCDTGCCAPATNANGDPVGPSICKQNDGKAYHCCGSVGLGGSCEGTNCCSTDAHNNNVCVRPCTTNQQCGAGHCVGVNFSSTAINCGDLGCEP